MISKMMSPLNIFFDLTFELYKYRATQLLYSFIFFAILSKSMKQKKTMKIMLSPWNLLSLSRTHGISWWIASCLETVLCQEWYIYRRIIIFIYFVFFFQFCRVIKCMPPWENITSIFFKKCLTEGSWKIVTTFGLNSSSGMYRVSDLKFNIGFFPKQLWLPKITSLTICISPLLSLTQSFLDPRT